MRLRGLLVVGLILLTACSSGDDTEAQLAEQEQRIAELEAALDAATSTTTTAASTTTTTAAPTTTTTAASTTTLATTTTAHRARVAGYLDLVGSEKWGPEGEEGCLGEGWFDDFAANMQIILKDEDGRTLSMAMIGVGKPHDAGDISTDYGESFCRFGLTFPDVPLDREFYAAESGRRGSVTFSRAQITAGLSLVIGND